jgi:hypothetical protein
LLLALLLAVVQPAFEPYGLAAYLNLATEYATGDREAAVRDIASWPPDSVRKAVVELQRHGGKLRAFAVFPGDIPIATVEAAVLLHAEAGLLALRAVDDRLTERHLGSALALLSWSQHAAFVVRSEAVDRARRVRRENAARPHEGEPTPRDVEIPPELDVRPRIDPARLSVALAAGAVAAGAPATARSFAEDALRRAPLDVEARFVYGCVAEGLAVSEALRGRASQSRHWLDEAVGALSEAVTLDAGSAPDPVAAPHQSERSIEAVLHLGRIALDQDWLPRARRCFETVEARTKDDRQRFLARLLLGRVAERERKPDEAIACYRRALESRPDSQSASFALAHALERQSGPAAAVPEVARALARRRPGAGADHWRSYLFGLPGLADGCLDRVRRQALGR